MATPKTLAEALSHVDAQPSDAHAIIRDYIAQKFGVAMLENVEHEELLEKLFKRIVNE